MNKNKEEKIILVKDCGERLSEPFIEYVKNQCKIAEDNMRKRFLENFDQAVLEAEGATTTGLEVHLRTKLFGTLLTSKDQATQNINNLDKGKK